MLDPHTATELTLNEIVHLCDDLIEAHGNMLPGLSLAPRQYSLTLSGVLGARWLVRLESLEIFIMAKITFIGAGSCIFAKNILGDSMLAQPFYDAHIARYDIDPQRLDDSRLVLRRRSNRNINQGRGKITTHLRPGEPPLRRRRDANYVVNAIQVGGYKPSTVIDFDIPKEVRPAARPSPTLWVSAASSAPCARCR